MGAPVVKNLVTKIAVVGTGVLVILPLAGFAPAAPAAPIRPAQAAFVPTGDVYPPTTTPVGCSLTAVKKKSHLKLNMSPNLGAGYYYFQVDTKIGNDWYRKLHKYITFGPYEVRVLNRPAGTYRVHCIGKNGYKSANSNTVKLVR